MKVYALKRSLSYDIIAYEDILDLFLDENVAECLADDLRDQESQTNVDWYVEEWDVLETAPDIKKYLK